MTEGARGRQKTNNMATKKPAKAKKSIDSLKNEAVDGKEVKGGVTGRVGAKFSAKDSGATLYNDDLAKPINRTRPPVSFPIENNGGDMT